MYESAFAELVGVRHAVSFGYARHALAGILAAGGLRAGDEVILSPLTCKVVPLALRSQDLRPVYVDIRSATLNLDPNLAAEAVGSATRAILFQHTYGHPGGHDAASQLAAVRGLLLVADCAQTLPCRGASAILTELRSAAIYSNNLLKPLPAASGGVAVTNDDQLAQGLASEAARLEPRGWRSRARLRLEIALHEWILRPGLYWPLFELNRRASLSHRDRPLGDEIATEIHGTACAPTPYQLRRGFAWLAQAEELANHVRECCSEYEESLHEIEGLELPLSKPGRPLYYFPVLVRDKEGLLERARRARVEVIAWPVQTPIYPVVNDTQLTTYGYEPGSCPVAEGVARRLVGLPTHKRITRWERQRVIALLRSHASV
jgi:dTDP-4-amino-4,6-dideoxygalactose transaminase